MDESRIPSKELHRIIAQYYANDKVQDYDFQKEALLAQLILEMREMNLNIGGS